MWSHETVRKCSDRPFPVHARFLETKRLMMADDLI